jgi:hypothetical protein
MHSELDKKYCKNVKIKMSASFLVILLFVEDRDGDPENSNYLNK